MDEFCFEPGFGKGDIEAACRALHLREEYSNCLFAACFHTDGRPPAVSFASRQILNLFGCLSLEELSNRLFLSSEPGAKFFFGLSQSRREDLALRMGKSRFFLQPAGANLTFLWRRVNLQKEALFLVVALVDVPQAFSRSTELWPDLSNLELMVSPGLPDPGFSFEEVLERWAKAYPGQTSLRFTWATDANNRFCFMSPLFEQVAGPLKHPILGRDFVQALSSFGVAIPEAIQRKIAEHRSFSDGEFMWPVSGAETGVPLRLGGFPCFDPNALFSGYRGFGVIHLNRAVKLNSGPLACRYENMLLKEAGASISNQSKPYAGFIEAGGAPIAQSPAAANCVAFYPGQPREEEDAARVTRFDPVSPEPLSEKPKATLSPGEAEAFREIALALGASEPDHGRGAGSEEVSHQSPQQAPEGNAHETAIPSDSASRVNNHSAILDMIPFGILVCRDKSVLYANQVLLDFLGFSDLRSFQIAQTDLPLLVPIAEQGSVKLQNVEGQELSFSIHTSQAGWEGQDALVLTIKLGPSQEHANGYEAKIRQFEREARELHTILDTATDGVAVIDGAGKILALNRSGEALFGYDQNEVLGKPFTMLVAPESRSQAEEYLRGLKDNGVFSLLNDGREILGLARQGGLIPLFVTLGQISDSRQNDADDQLIEGEQKETKYCALLRDLTHWKKVEQELEDARAQAERASALKSDFLAKVSHEIRTPLNAILGFAEVIIDERFGSLGNERYKDYLKDIHTSGVLVMSIVNDLLDLSKIEAGKMDLDFIAVDANQIVADCVAIMQPQASRERVIMRLALSQNLPLVSADERSLRQIILNLLSNAIKFNEPGGQVIVATRLTEARQIIIRIRDTGLGMSDEDIKIALEPFRQLATSRPSGGTGLGLPLTKALVEANRAYFSIKSKKQEGTMVEITFPSARIFAD